MRAARALVRSIPVLTLLLTLLPTTALSNGIGTIFVLSPEAGRVTVFERTSHTVVATLDVGESPHGVAFSPDTFTAFVASAAGHLAQVDRDRYEVAARLATPGAPAHVAVAPTGQRVYFTDSSASTLSIIELVGQAARRQINLAGPGHGLAVSADDRRIYVAVPESGTMPAVDPSNGQIASQIPVGTGARHLSFSPDGGWLYVLRPEAGSVEVVDPRNDTVVTSIPVGPGTTDLAFSPDGRQALVSGESPNQLTVIDVTAHRLATRHALPVPDTASGVAVDDGFGYLAVPTQNRVYVLEKTGWSVVRQMNVERPDSIATVPDPFILRVIPRELPATGGGNTLDPRVLAGSLVVLAGVTMLGRKLVRS